MRKNTGTRAPAPACIGVIMDGNRRWARERGLPVFAGHKKGYETLKNFVSWAADAGVSHIIAYAFSTENWKRSKREVEMLMKLFGSILEEGEEFKKRDIEVTFIGQKERFSEELREGMARLERNTRRCKKLHLTIALSYGGRAEIVSAANNLLHKGARLVTEAVFAKHLWTKGVPDPDIIIRTGGEKRLSNFLLWQCAYSELFFVDTYWPAFSKKEFNDILSEYARREKRQGK